MNKDIIEEIEKELLRYIKMYSSAYSKEIVVLSQVIKDIREAEKSEAATKLLNSMRIHRYGE